MIFSFFKKTTSIGLIIGLFFISQNNVWSQEASQMQQEKLEVSDVELNRFANALHKLQGIQDSTQQEMIAAVENTGLEVETYNQVMKELQNAESMEDVNASEEKVQQVQQAYQEVQEIQISQEQEIAEAIQEEGLKSDRFQKILQAVQQDPELMQRLQNLDEEE